MTEPTPPLSDLPLSANELAVQRTDLAKQRTLLSFERTRMAKDRTMFAMLRTSLSMIGFGFTIFSFFRTLGSHDMLGDAVPPQAPARFGLALVVMGILVLVHGIWFDRASVKRLDADRAELVAGGLLPETAPMPPSSIQFIGMLLLLLALFAILSMAARAGPFA
jgi:putative membrane protein